MKWAEPELTGRALEIDRLMRVRIDPQRRLDSAAAVALSGFRRSLPLLREERDKAGGEQHSDLVEADLAAALGGRLSQLAENHQFGERWHADGAPDVRPIPDCFDQSRSEVERQTFVPTEMLVRADILVSGMTDKDRPGYQLEGPAP